MTTQPRVAALLQRLAHHRTELQRLSSLSQADLLADPDRVASAKYNFVVAIEGCIDIANHLIAVEGFRMPKDNADSFVVLAERGVIPGALRDPLRSMARFRNRLVHMYWDVDDTLVAEYLRDSLGDLDRFAQAVSRGMTVDG